MRSFRAGAPLTYLVVYVLAVVLGRSAVVEGRGLALFWPAAGVAAVWMLRGRTRPAVLMDATLLLVASGVVDLSLGIAPVPALLFGLANLVLGVTVRACSSALERRSFWGELPRRLARPRDLVDLGLAALVASLTSAPAGLAGAYIASGHLAWLTTIAWVVRNSCGTFVVAAAVLAVLTLWPARQADGWTAFLLPERRDHSLAELVMAGAVALGSAAFVFGASGQLPIAFVMLAAATWIGARFSPAVGGIHAVTFATVAVLCSHLGRGPFGSIADLTERAVVVQLFALLTAVIVLMLSLGVSERVKLHARAVESEARATSRAELLDAVMNRMTDGLMVLDASGNVVMRNTAARSLAGDNVDRSRLSDARELGICHLDGSPLETEELPHLRALRGEVVPTTDVLRIDPDTGEQSTLSIGAVPLHRSAPRGGRLAVVLIHDVTKERAHRRELQAFAGTVAHDLKAPLTGVGSWAEILGDQLDALEVDVSEPRSSLRRIESSAQRMEQLISDLLAYSQAQSATLAPVPLSLSGLVEGVARELREAGTGTPPIIEHGPLGRVLADRTLVEQLLHNVIGNAVKYVAPGTTPHVLIGSELVGDMLEIRVADNGIGIPRAERGRIFDSFYRASSSGSYPGTGLGLAICARAVERHGGRISAREGLDGGGTTLVFTLPADLDQEVDQAAPDAPDSLDRLVDGVLPGAAAAPVGRPPRGATGGLVGRGAGTPLA